MPPAKSDRPLRRDAEKSVRPSIATALPGKTHFVRNAAELGPLVRAQRKKMRLNQQSFADLAGVGRRFLSELEAGKPTLEFDRVLKVCAAAGIDLNATLRA